MSLFAELKRRNVFRIGIAYLIVAWLLMQVAALAVPALRLPDWVTTFVVFILLLGFPVALLLAWAYEITPDGIKKAKEVPLEKSVSNLTAKKLNYLVIGLLVISVGLLLADKFGSDRNLPGTATAQLDAEPSLAVLPFTNMSADPGQEHFADGLTEELLNALASIDGLRLVSRTSSFSFKGENIPLAEIAAQLGVEHILEGSVRRAGNQIRVTAQLIEADSDSHLWSQTYDRELSVSNVIEVQEDVATAVTAVLHASLRPADQRSLRLKGPASIEALDQYHEGMTHLQKIMLGEVDFEDRSVFEAAVRAFEASIEIDREWAPSHAGLGRVHHFWKHINEEEQLRISREHVMDAIRLDDRYGPAYASLGYLESLAGNYQEAFDAYDRATALGAGNNWGRAILLSELARYDQAVSEYRKAVAWMPLSLAVKGQMMNALYCADQTSELEAVAREMVGLVQDSAGPRSMLAYALARNGKKDEALRLADEVAANDGNELGIVRVLAVAGREERARAAIHSVNDGTWWWTRVPAAVILGDTNVAVDILELAERESRAGLTEVRCPPEIRTLAGNPRFDALLLRLNLPE